VGASFINKKAPVRRIFEPEAFHSLIFNTIMLTSRNHTKIGSPQQTMKGIERNFIIIFFAVY
jgi:hypothetical protein|tara:strand:- start:121 stop:306 length:186 start_codon:yes stop_codon:yes gene_type:complete